MRYQLVDTVNTTKVYGRRFQTIRGKSTQQMRCKQDCASSLFELCVRRWNDLPQKAFEVKSQLLTTVNSFKSHLDRIRHNQMEAFHRHVDR